MRKQLIPAKDIEFKARDKGTQRWLDVEALHFPLGSASGKDLIITTEDGDQEWRGIADVDLCQVIKVVDEHVE